MSSPPPRPSNFHELSLQSKTLWSDNTLQWSKSEDRHGAWWQDWKDRHGFERKYPSLEEPAASAKQLRAQCEVIRADAQTLPTPGPLSQTKKAHLVRMIRNVAESWPDIIEAAFGVGKYKYYVSAESEALGRSKEIGRALQIMQQELDILGTAIDQAQLAKQDQERSADTVSVELKALKEGLQKYTDISKFFLEIADSPEPSDELIADMREATEKCIGSHMTWNPTVQSWLQFTPSCVAEARPRDALDLLLLVHSSDWRALSYSGLHELICSQVKQDTAPRKVTFTIHTLEISISRLLTRVRVEPEVPAETALFCLRAIELLLYITTMNASHKSLLRDLLNKCKTMKVANRTYLIQGLEDFISSRLDASSFQQMADSSAAFIVERADTADAIVPIPPAEQVTVIADTDGSLVVFRRPHIGKPVRRLDKGSYAMHVTDDLSDYYLTVTNLRGDGKDLTVMVGERENWFWRCLRKACEHLFAEAVAAIPEEDVQ